jgi:hypothetical protein
LGREIDEFALTYYSAITTESQTASYRRIEGDWAPISSPVGSIFSAARNQSWIDFDVSFDRQSCVLFEVLLISFQCPFAG